MDNNKVSEKAVWEGCITPDDDTPSIASQMQTQPQMMFCYKCNNVIPGNSKFCPCCNIELYTICPKCGEKYSSQYSICSQCGTNRVKFWEAQRREQERKEAIERENKRRQEILEKEKREREQKEALERQQRETRRRQQLAAYERQKERIMNTKEYQSTYSILKESLESYRWKNVFHLFDVKKREQYILQYISNKNCYYNKYIVDYILEIIRDPFYQYTYDVLDNLSQWCIDAYKKQKKSK